MNETETRPGKKRIPRWRAWLGIFALVLIFGLAGAYHYATRPERLRAYARHWLEEFTGGEVRVERVDFNPTRGLSLVGVSLAAPLSAARTGRHLV